MLIKCKSMLLLTDVKAFAEKYKRLCDESMIIFQTEDSWNKNFRVSTDVVVLGTKYVGALNPVYYSKAVLMLKDNEYPAEYIAKGITRFIFNFRDNRELALAFYKPEREVVHSNALDLTEVLKDTDVLRFKAGDYDFKFDLNQFSYKNQPIYITKSAKRYLIDWLLYGTKDSSRRQILCKLRKKFGKDFMKDIDRNGQIKEVKDE